MCKLKKFKPEHWHKIALIVAFFDIVLVNFGYFWGLWFRYDCAVSRIPSIYLTNYFAFIPINTVLCVGIFLLLRLYKSIWRFASYTELVRTVIATVVNTLLHILLMSLLFGKMPISYYVIGSAVQLFACIAIRFSYRVLILLRDHSHGTAHTSAAKQTMLIGAGDAGLVILREVNRTCNLGNMQICCIVDDNSNKWGRYIDGVPVIGGREAILFGVKKYNVQNILFAIPSATPAQKRDILNICKETGCQIKSLPGVGQIVSGQVTVENMRQVAVEDLLGRDPICVDNEEIGQFVSHKTVLVTGGGGSIGSELCRQIAAHDPRLLIIFDVYENNAYEIEQELRKTYPQLNLLALIGSVRDSRRLTEVFDTYRPEIVFHAAAHKHVPLMEKSPCEAIKNNVIGTYKTAYAAMIYGCSRFVLISTDKAVNPTNIMGASKRLCEMIIQSFDRAIKTGTADRIPMLFTHRVDGTKGVPKAVITQQFRTEYVAVRFGNVLGSNGSVIPLFKKQIASGGPVTVTHPDIIRYFMTIPEAVSLVMQAGAYAKGGEIFVLDMGVPMKIDTLARNLIRLSGMEPDVDIPIVYTGLRPGEKLYEEKLMAEEGLEKTPNALIHIGNPIPFDGEQFLADLEALMKHAYENDADITDMVARIVTTYHPNRGGTGTQGGTFRELYREAVGAK